MQDHKESEWINLVMQHFYFNKEKKHIISSLDSYFLTIKYPVERKKLYFREN